MPFTTLTPIAAPAGYGSAGTTLGTLAALTAVDNSNGNQFVSTGHEVLFIYNSDSSAHTLTVTAGPDREGRLQNLVQSCVATTFYLTQLFPAFGWNVGGYITLPAGQDATLKVAVLQFPF